MFHHLVQSGKTDTQLLSFVQGSALVNDYSIQFGIYVAESGFRIQVHAVAERPTLSSRKVLECRKLLPSLHLEQQVSGSSYQREVHPPALPLDQ